MSYTPRNTLAPVAAWLSAIAVSPGTAKHYRSYLNSFVRFVACRIRQPWPLTQGDFEREESVWCGMQSGIKPGLNTLTGAICRLARGTLSRYLIGLERTASRKILLAQSSALRNFYGWLAEGGFTLVREIVSPTEARKALATPSIIRRWIDERQSKALLSPRVTFAYRTQVLAFLEFVAKDVGQQAVGITLRQRTGRSARLNQALRAAFNDGTFALEYVLLIPSKRQRQRVLSILRNFYDWANHAGLSDVTAEQIADASDYRRRTIIGWWLEETTCHPGIAANTAREAAKLLAYLCQQTRLVEDPVADLAVLRKLRQGKNFSQISGRGANWFLCHQGKSSIEAYLRTRSPYLTRPAQNNIRCWLRAFFDWERFAQFSPGPESEVLEEGTPLPKAITQNGVKSIKTTSDPAIAVSADLLNKLLTFEDPFCVVEEKGIGFARSVRRDERTYFQCSLRLMGMIEESSDLSPAEVCALSVNEVEDILERVEPRHRNKIRDAILQLQEIARAIGYGSAFESHGHRKLFMTIGGRALCDA